MVENVTIPSRNDVVAGVSIGLLSCLAVLVNCGGILMVWRKKALHNSFGFICVSHCAGDTIVNLVTLFWCTPLILVLDTEKWSASRLGFTICAFVQMATYGVIYTHVVQSINRLVAISRPYVYHRYFKPKNTLFFLGVVWTLAFAHLIVYLLGTCHMYYNGTIYMWSYEKSDCGEFLAYYLDFIYNSALEILIFTSDCVTFCFIRQYHKKAVRELEDASAWSYKLHESKQINRVTFFRDIRFLLQGAVYTIMYVTLSICGIIIGDVSESNWPIRLIYDTLVWILATFIEGTIVILFNYSLR
ncbi:serpentine type 7TM GPCR chemoreceptor srx domain-containing protein [Ditylenchus destructor]|nr:serpentine type 7TM GPCR chemoreceptor srx domain-containing protein [Ditylenchus destructor]